MLFVIFNSKPQSLNAQYHICVATLVRPILLDFVGLHQWVNLVNLFWSRWTCFCSFFEAILGIFDQVCPQRRRTWTWTSKADSMQRSTMTRDRHEYLLMLLATFSLSGMVGADLDNHLYMCLVFEEQHPNTFTLELASFV